MAKPEQRRNIYILSRSVVVVVVGLAFGSFFWTPSGPLAWTFDVTFRAWLMFIGTVMAHDATHGLLGSSKRSNGWWGRIALLPSTVPFINFRMTHWRHHHFTNDPEQDPDFYLKPRRSQLEVLYRALWMPHQWILWLSRRGHLKKLHVLEWALNYVGIWSIYLAIAYVVGAERFIWGLIPSLLGVSWLLWHPFALKSHEGWSQGAAEFRSHNYYGQFVYWFTLGLSMHRVHHMRPSLSWIELLPFVESHPDGAWRGLLFRRDVRLEPQG